MKVVIGARFKGGQGTSTTLTCLQNGLFKRDIKTLLVDLDEQGNSTIAMGGSQDKATMHEVINGDVDINEAIQNTWQGDLIAGNTSLKKLEALGMGDGYLENLTKMRDAFSKLAGYEYVLIDTPPRISGFLIESALTSADEVIIPVEASSFATQGLPKLQKKIDVIRKNTNPDIKVDGILLTRHNPRTILNNEVATTIEKWADSIGTKVYKTFIREGVVVKESQAKKTSLFDYAPDSKPAQDYQNWIKEYLKESL